VTSDTRFFALLDNEHVVLIAGAHSWDDAFVHEPEGTIWVFTENGLRDLVWQIAVALDESVPDWSDGG